MEPIKIVDIGDLHIGSPATDRLPEEIKLFTNYLNSHEVDLLVLNGDYFDHKFNLTPPDPQFLFGISLFNDILDIAGKKHFKIILVHGTRSHDRFQTRVLYSMVPKDGSVDCRYYETATADDFDFGEKGKLHVMIAPEEYPLNVQELYGPFEKQTFDLMFGHGTWDDIVFSNLVNENENNEAIKAPVFVWNDWKFALAKGLVVFGHIHSRHIIKESGVLKIVYPGSYTSWNFGNTTPCGFCEVDFWSDTKKYKVNIIDNTKAPVYKSIKFKDLGLDPKNLTVEEIQKAINEQKEGSDYLKVNIDDIPDQNTRKLVEKIFDGEKGITAEEKPVATQGLNEQVDHSVYDKYEWLLKETLPLNQTVQKFAKEELKKDLTLDDIDKMIKD